MTKNSLRQFFYFTTISVVLVIVSTSCKPVETDPNVLKLTITLDRPKLGEPYYSYVPFEVPNDTKSISVDYKYDKNDGANRVEVGLFDPAFSGENSDKKGFRGWSGSVRDAFFISEDSATHGYVAGEIKPGKWHLVFGQASIEEGGVDVEITINLNQIDEKAKEQFEKESNRDFSFKKKEKVERLKTDDLTWFAGDLHAHSFHSDGRWSIKGILESASSNNLDFVGITEHNTFSHHKVIEELSKNYSDLLILKGEEVTTYGGHINVWGLPKNEWVDFRVFPNEEKSAIGIKDEAEKLGGLASINHPMMDCKGCRWSYGKWKNMPAVEIWNATWDEQDEIALQEWDRLLLNDVKITGIASTDSHQRPEEPSTYPTNLAIGEPTVFVGAKEKTKDGILDGVKNGKVFVADNSRRRMMLTADGKATIGDTVEVKWGKTIKFDYTLEGFPNGSKFWLYANGQVAKEFLIYDKKYTGVYKIYAHQDGYVRLEVRDASGKKMLGFSNPIYFRVEYPKDAKESSE